MYIIDFVEQFGTDEQCKKFLKEKRESQGITCRCGSKKHYWFENQELWKCAKCGTRKNLTAGTVMDKTKIPLSKWFMCIYYMTSTKKSISILEMSRLIKGTYSTVFLMTHKIRNAMGQRDLNYQLDSEIEMDDAFFETYRVGETTPVEMKRGRGSERQASVLVMTESKANPDNKNPKRASRALGYVKMIAADTTAVAINDVVKKNINKESIVLTDGWRGYAQVKNHVKAHFGTKTPKKEAHIKLPWVHKIISNSKKMINGVHHSVSQPYLQNYLNEFTYKLNRRDKEDMFDSLIRISAHVKPVRNSIKTCKKVVVATLPEMYI